MDLYSKKYCTLPVFTCASMSGICMKDTCKGTLWSFRSLLMIWSNVLMLEDLDAHSCYQFHAIPLIHSWWRPRAKKHSNAPGKAVKKKGRGILEKN